MYPLAGGNVFGERLPGNDKGDAQADRQQGDLISFRLVFQNKESRLNMYAYIVLPLRGTCTHLILLDLIIQTVQIRILCS
jgi:hypothetical protein